MKRIVLLVLRLLCFVPGWLMKIHHYNKHLEDTTFEERFAFGQKVVRKINSKARVNMHCFGKDNLPEEQGYLLAPNHQGMFDPLIMFEFMDKPFKAVLKKELTDVPVLKDVITMFEFQAMDRDNLRASMKVIKTVTKQMSEGTNYLIFPEGTRCRKQNQMLEFKGGTFKTAIDSKKPIVPVALIDCYKVFDDSSIAKVDAQVHFLEPLYYEDYQDMNSTEIAQLVQSRVQACIQINENKY